MRHGGYIHALSSLSSDFHNRTGHSRKCLWLVISQRILRCSLVHLTLKPEFLWQSAADYQGLIGDRSFNIAQIIPTVIEFMFC